MILLYHRIAALDSDPLGACVPPGAFRDQMELLRREYRPMALEALADAAAAGNLPEGAVAVTFDDGYLDALETASPILAELGIPATFFVSTGRLDEPHELWWDTVARILAEEPRVGVALELTLDGAARHYATGTAEERALAHRAVSETLVRASRVERDAVLAQLTAWSGRALVPRASHRPMTAAEIVRLAGRPGHAIGGHTVHHLYLPVQPLAVQRREVTEDKARLERLLGRPLRAFAYPYGGLGSETVEVVREAGYAVAVTADAGAVGPGADPLRLPRLEATWLAGERFARRLRSLVPARRGAP